MPFFLFFYALLNEPYNKVVDEKKYIIGNGHFWFKMTFLQVYIKLVASRHNHQKSSLKPLWYSSVLCSRSTNTPTPYFWFFVFIIILPTAGGSNPAGPWLNLLPPWATIVLTNRAETVPENQSSIGPEK